VSQKETHENKGIVMKQHTGTLQFPHQTTTGRTSETRQKT